MISRRQEIFPDLPVDEAVSYLMLAVKDASVGDEARQMAAVLLRRIMSSEFEDFFPKLPAEAQTQFKNELLLMVQNEGQSGIRKKIGEVVAEVGRQLMDDEGNNLWPEFLKFLFDAASSANPGLKEAALQMFGSVPGIFGVQQQNYLDVIKQMLQQCMADQANYNVRFQAMKAFSAFILLHDDEPNVQKHFTDLFGPFVQMVMETIEKQDDDTLLKCLVDMAENSPKFLRSQMDLILRICTQSVGNTELPESWRQLALEVVVTLSETAPATVRKAGSAYITSLVTACLHMMTDLEEEEDWSTSDDLAEEDNDSNHVVAESALDRLACGLGGKTVLPHVLSNIPTMMSNPNWQYRHAALMAISAVGEGCHKQMEPMLPQIMDGVLNYLTDPHPRVRYAACNAIGQMSTDFAPIFEKKFHERVVPGLLMLMDDNANPRVQAHAGAALVNFSEDCPKNILANYLDNIMAKLETVLSLKFKELVERGSKLVLEQVVTTIASVADTSEEKFVAYYDRFMPCLKYIIQHAVTPELRLLRGKTIECVSLIGLAVGAEKFTRDASEVMDMLLKTQTEGGEMADDDPQVSYMISAWARICKILGRQFQPYLPMVMGPVLKAASMKPEVALLDSEEIQTVEGDDDWQFVSLSDQQNFGIKTAGLEEKATACQMLVCYARELKEGFAEYTEQVVKLMVPMLKFYFHDGVRSAAAESLPFLLECARIKGPQYLQDMWAYIRPELLKALDTEPEKEVLAEQLTALAKCIETLGNGCFDDESMAELVKILDRLLKEHFERAQERQDKRKDEDYDEIVEEQLVDEDDEDVYILSKVSEVIHSLMATYRTAFLPVLENLMPHFIKLMGPDRSWPDHQWAICVFDDIIEFAGPESIKYQEFFLQPFLNFLADKSGEVRQAAAYGWGVLGMCGGSAYAAACAQAMPRLIEMINAPDSRGPENINPTENGISAVTKILKFNSSALNVSDILPLWLSWLPVWEDEDEAPYIYSYLCDLIEANHPLILGPNNSNLPRLIAVIAETFSRDVLETDHEVYTRLLNIVRQIQGNSVLMEAVLAQLTQDQKQALEEALTVA
nr:EOG090X00U8 [Triops cancriformis]